ncbi:uncharacterized protein LY89DRAFT_779805 [Mollisia scopiformis]|uniref:Filamentation protein n=1 Tax=Mollisia scopiformis TaxID=149040 RepID=A0A194XIH1_MOLSC|nr:uncharacterized protein LY89DRAFT_779805 [Mollisia scopiformis]KUJ19926.1 hypothetical protein LY89DRAFT_779805 [Mollisia scopiformis]
MSREQTKAALYIQQLDEARCNGDWDAVPELIRKIKKHAPQRTCLAITAESEHAVVQASHTRPLTARPSTARPATANTSTSAQSSLRRYIDLLLEAIGNERTYVEDEFQARVCLGWIHWQMGELSLAVNKLPHSIEQDFSQLDGTDKESAEWTRVCALKASYLKGSSQEKLGAVAEALDTYESALPVLSSMSNPKQGKELRCWTELYLTGFCILSSQAVKSKMSSILETETLSAFRCWARFWDAQSAAPTGGRAVDAGVPRRQVWKEYYITLSDLLQQDLPFPTTSLTTAYVETSTRLQQRAELKRVEARYETLLLSEVQFPKANEASDEVEAFADIVVQNWRVLCGSGWDERDLGEGGAETVSRGVLDILYRAATKTFHSTAVLRHLFTVHLAVAEFDLAFKAFDTYLEIVKKGKARVDKTGEAEHSLDDDETVLKTASECIKALCRYGSRQGTEKAKELGHFFEDWLDKHHPNIAHNGNGRLIENGNASATSTAIVIAPRVFAVAWRCIGIGHAQWSRLTYDASSRSEIQLQAIKCFRKALSPEYESTKDVETLFALGMVLAERRELPAAIEVVKAGLLPNSSSNHTNELGPHTRRFARERSLIPLWHLMALLLSARQEFTTAARSCEGAFEQFRDPKFLFGEADLPGTYRSAHLNEKRSPQHQGIVDNMDDFEKQGVLEVKMTQLALIEVLEGPDIAVNASDELLSLYTRLFGDPQKESATSISASNTLTGPPKSSAGTIRSIRGSIFSRTGRSSVRKPPLSGNTITEEKSASDLRPHTTQTMASMRAPTIHVTNENGSATSRKEHSQHHHEKLQKRNDSVSKKKGGSLRKRSGSTSRKRSSSEGNSARPTVVDDEKFFTPPLDSANHDEWFKDNQTDSREGSAGNAPNQLNTVSRPLPPKSQQMNYKEKSLKPAYSNPSIAQDNRLPHISPYSSSTNPVTRFSKEQERRRRTTILVKVWLLISGFYRRASLYEDCRGAIAEAEKLVRGVENEISKDTTGNISSDQAGWAGGKSVGEVWADVLAERGYLAVAEASPYDALTHFESSLTYFADHPAAIIGLSNILLDVYSEDLLPPTTIPKLELPTLLSTPSQSTLNTSAPPTTPLTNQPPPLKHSSTIPLVSHGPLGLPSAKSSGNKNKQDLTSTPNSLSSGLQPSYKESSTALLDRLAARDRAYGLLTGLTKLGTGWNNSEAWFALSRAYEEGGQPDKAREVLWWCVELEEGRGVRDWSVVSSGGYVF